MRGGQSRSWLSVAQGAACSLVLPAAGRFVALLRPNMPNTEYLNVKYRIPISCTCWGRRSRPEVRVAGREQPGGLYPVSAGQLTRVEFTASPVADGTVHQVKGLPGPRPWTAAVRAGRPWARRQ
jgi:hypothetical protein